MNEIIVTKYCGQIFAETLGQVCHEEFYKNTTFEYQEIPFIFTWALTNRGLLSSHCCHNIFTNCYAKLPNIFLKNIARLDFKYRKTHKMEVVLHHPRRHHMNRTDEHLIFWTHSAKMMWYLFSDNAMADICSIMRWILCVHKILNSILMSSSILSLTSAVCWKQAEEKAREQTWRKAGEQYLEKIRAGREGGIGRRRILPGIRFNSRPNYRESRISGIGSWDWCRWSKWSQFLKWRKAIYVRQVHNFFHFLLHSPITIP